MWYLFRFFAMDSEFESDLWGIEIIFVRLCRLQPSLVWIRPLRDWNYLTISFRFITYYSLNQTFEGLKSDSYVARSWDSDKFESDLWGIEIATSRGSKQIGFKCLNQTFEGLKFFRPPHEFCADVQFESDLWGIEISSFSLKGASSIFCLNQTFEGLKLPGLIFDLIKAYLVWIRPLRDWNALIIK